MGGSSRFHKVCKVAIGVIHTALETILLIQIFGQLVQSDSFLNS